MSIFQKILIRSFIAGISLCLIFAFNNISHADSQQGRLIELIIDASGSMNGKLAQGKTKIAAAKEAVATLVKSLPDDQELAFRAYGHQSPREKHDCQDTQLLVEMKKLSDSRNDILSQAKSLQARGYTPISFVLGLAVKDFPEKFSGEKVIVLVSDGKETCEGDPCSLAKQLKQANPKLVIHTVGLGVDEATRDQLQCIAEVTGGTYFAANESDMLAKKLGEAIATPAKNVDEETGFGWLSIKRPDLAGHQIINAETGEAFEKDISALRSTVKLPAGIYNVTFGKMVWKSVVVKPNEKTLLVPGWIRIKHPNLKGHAILDAETGELLAELGVTKSSISILPGEYDVTFGKAVWRVKVKQGETTILDPGVVSVRHASYRGHPIFNNQGEVIGKVSNLSTAMSLPPGDYAIQIGGKKIKFHLNEGDKKIFENK